MTGLVRIFLRHARRFGVFTGGIGNVVDGRGKLFYCAGLLGSALCKRLCAIGNLLGTGGYLIDRGHRVGDHIAQGRDHRRKVVGYGLQCAGEIAVDGKRKIAVGHAGGHACYLADGVLQHGLADMERRGDFTNLVAGFIGNRAVKVALAHRNNRIARFGQRYADRADDPNSKDDRKRKEDHRHSNKDRSERYNILGFVVVKGLDFALQFGGIGVGCLGLRRQGRCALHLQDAGGRIEIILVDRSCDSGKNL